MAIAEAQYKVVMRHTKSVHDKLNIASKILGITSEMTDEAKIIYNELFKIKVTQEQVDTYFNMLYLTKAEFALVTQTKLKYYQLDEISTKKKNTIKDVHKYYEIGVGQSNIKGTAWGAYNAVTGYYQNVKKYTTGDKKMRDISMEGGAFKKSADAIKLAIRMAEL